MICTLSPVLNMVTSTVSPALSLACEEFNADGGVIFARNLTAIFTPWA